MSKQTQVFALSLMVLSGPSFAQSSAELLKKALVNYKKGSYRETVLFLKKVKGSKKTRSTKQYWLGLAQSKLQNYDLSMNHFAKALKLGNKTTDLYYEYGQSLYANNEIEKAREVFFRSYKKNFKGDTSLYYVAHISQILEEYTKAEKTYRKLLKIPKLNKNLKQVASFQLIESKLSLGEKDPRIADKVEDEFLPGLKKALSIDSSSGIAGDIKKRIKDLQKKYSLDPSKMRNGRRIPRKKLTAYLSHKWSYDSNITLTTDVPTTQGTQKDSFIFKTTGFTNYKFDFFRRVFMAPEVRIDHTYHSDRDSDSVYSNDAYSINPAIRNTWEHKLLKRTASILFDIDYSYSARDRDKNRSLIFANRSITYTAGYKIKIWSIGDTAARLKYKDFTSFTPESDNKTYTFSLNQTAIFSGGKMLIALFQFDGLDSATKANSTDSYLFRFDYIIPNVYRKYNISLAHALTLLDTKEQSETRGTEKKTNPSISVFKRPTKAIKITASYDYTRNFSKDEDSNGYEKHTYGLEFRYDF